MRSPCPVHRACTLTAESTRQVLSLDRLVSRPSAGTDESHNFTKARYNVCESSTVLPSFRCHSLHTLYILDPFSPHWLYILDPFSSRFMPSDCNGRSGFCHTCRSERPSAAARSEDGVQLVECLFGVYGQVDNVTRQAREDDGVPLSCHAEGGGDTMSTPRFQTLFRATAAPLRVATMASARALARDAIHRRPAAASQSVESDADG